MTNQLNFSITKPTELEVHLNDLESKRIEVKNAGFELLEIWHTGDIQSHEIWKNSVTSESIKLQILTQPSEPVDASRQDEARLPKG